MKNIKKLEDISILTKLFTSILASFLALRLISSFACCLLLELCNPVMLMKTVTSRADLVPSSGLAKIIQTCSLGSIPSQGCKLQHNSVGSIERTKYV